MGQSVRDLEAFSRWLANEGPQRALQYLNSGVPHRYTGIYRFEGEVLRNAALYDKRGLMRPDYLIAVPFAQSFCQYVRRDQAFRTDNSSEDERLAGSPYRGVVVSYHSVPIVNAHGALWGTLSHFHMSIAPLEDSEFELLRQAAVVLCDYIPQLAD